MAVCMKAQRALQAKKTIVVNAPFHQTSNLKNAPVRVSVPI